MSLTSYAQKKLGDHALAIASYTMPTVRLGLFSASPGENGSLSGEISGGSYARQALTSAMGAADSTTGIALNTSAITFPVPTAAWGTVAYLGAIDALTLGTGNVLWYTQMTNPRVVNNGDAALVFDIGSLSFSIAGIQSIMITSYLMKKLVDHATGKSSFTMPTAVYHGLLNASPTIAGTMSSEVNVGGYARRPLAGVIGAFDSSTGISVNASDLSYPNPTADYPDVNYSFIADAAGVGAGNMLFAGQLPSMLDIAANGAAALFPAGAIRIAID
jgi:hypothetical protein